MGAISKLLSLVGRYGPVVAALLVGAGGLLDQFAPGSAPAFKAVLDAIVALGVTPDSEVLKEFGAVVASALLAYGGTRKTINIVKEKLGKQ